MIPKFSIIVPVHNAENHMRKCMDSIAEQVYRNYELICVCDSCTDRSAEIAASYGAKVLEVEFHRDGLSRNAGLDIASGEWVLFLDDDDWWMHEYVLTMLDSMVSTQFDILLFSFIWKGMGYFTQDGQRHYVACWNKCWRREFIGETRFSDIYRESDLDFDRAMFAKGPRCALWDTPFYYYNYLHEGSMNWKLINGLEK